MRLYYHYFPVFLFLVSFSANAQSAVDANKAAFHVGESLMVCGDVSEVKDLSRRTLININHKYPNESLSILIWESNKSEFYKRFGNLSFLVGKKICADGKLELYKGSIQMVMKNPQLLRLMK